MKSLLLLVLTISLAAAGCGGGSSNNSSPTPPPQSATLSSLQVTSPSSTVPLGGIQSLTATGTYSDGHTRDLTDKVSWSSSAGNIATVTVLGDVTGVAPGRVTITAVSGPLQDSIDLTVGSSALARIDISPSSPSTPPNTTQQLIALGRYSDGTVREVNDLVTWSSSDPSKVTISATGLARALRGGPATVTAKAGDIIGSATMTVTAAQLVRMAVLPYQPVTGIGVRQQFVALGTFDDYGTHQLASVTWSSSSPAIASIAADGLAIPLQSGSTTITGAVGNISNATALTVLPASLASILINPGSASMAVGTDQQFIAKGRLTDGSLVELPVIAWASSDSAVGRIGSGGRTVAVAPGTTTISASVAGVAASTLLTVTSAQLQSITVAPGSPSVPILSMKQLYAVGTFSDGTTQDLTTAATWWSNDSRVATVSKGGLVSSNASGFVTMAASLGSVLGSTTLQVSPITVNSVTLVPENAVIAAGTKLRYSLFSNLSDGTTALLDAPRWYTSPITMATAETSGIVTARTPGIGKVYGETCCKTNFTALTVTNAHAQTLTVTPVTAVIPTGAVQQLQATATFDDGSAQDVSTTVHWISSRPSLVSVDGSGSAVALNQGTATVTATFGPVSGSSQTVTAVPISVTVVAGQVSSLTVDPGSASISLGESQQLSVLGRFSDQSLHAVPEVTWSSSDPAVAIVLPTGLVISSGKGTAVITAHSIGAQGSASITVE